MLPPSSELQSQAKQKAEAELKKKMQIDKKKEEAAKEKAEVDRKKKKESGIEEAEADSNEENKKQFFRFPDMEVRGQFVVSQQALHIHRMHRALIEDVRSFDMDKKLGAYKKIREEIEEAQRSMQDSTEIFGAVSPKLFSLRTHPQFRDLHNEVREKIEREPKQKKIGIREKLQRKFKSSGKKKKVERAPLSPEKIRLAKSRLYQKEKAKTKFFRAIEKAKINSRTPKEIEKEIKQSRASTKTSSKKE